MKEEYIQRGYDNQKQAYILDRYVNGLYVGSFTAYLNHRTRTFKCYPRTLASFAPLQGVIILPETQVKHQLS
ncbi:MAG: hypothetical protein J6A16_08205, partial [Oscillospiraceae bacterium]|nr:hypothetical protein [Oscillospiraceae bacterium]